MSKIYFGALMLSLGALSALGIPDELIFVDRKSGTDAEREGLKAMLACARPGDTRWSCKT